MTDTPTDKKLSERLFAVVNYDSFHNAGRFVASNLREILSALCLAESHPSAIREAVEGEREACAKIAEMFSINKTPIHPDVPWIAMGENQQRVAHMTCQCVAEAIRARTKDNANG